MVFVLRRRYMPANNLITTSSWRFMAKWFWRFRDVDARITRHICVLQDYSALAPCTSSEQPVLPVKAGLLPVKTFEKLSILGHFWNVTDVMAAGPIGWDIRFPNWTISSVHALQDVSLLYWLIDSAGNTLIRSTHDTVCLPNRYSRVQEKAKGSHCVDYLHRITLQSSNLIQHRTNARNCIIPGRGKKSYSLLPRVAILCQWFSRNGPRHDRFPVGLKRIR